MIFRSVFVLSCVTPLEFLSSQYNSVNIWILMSSSLLIYVVAHSSILLFIVISCFVHLSTKPAHNGWRLHEPRALARDMVHCKWLVLCHPWAWPYFGTKIIRNEMSHEPWCAAWWAGHSRLSRKTVIRHEIAHLIGRSQTSRTENLDFIHPPTSPCWRRFS